MVRLPLAIVAEFCMDGRPSKLGLLLGRRAEGFALVLVATIFPGCTRTSRVNGTYCDHEGHTRSEPTPEPINY